MSAVTELALCVKELAELGRLSDEGTERLNLILSPLVPEDDDEYKPNDDETPSPQKAAASKSTSGGKR